MHRLLHYEQMPRQAKQLAELCACPARDLFNLLPDELKTYYRPTRITTTGYRRDNTGFIYCKSDTPVCVVAHLDTVYNKPLALQDIVFIPFVSSDKDGFLQSRFIYDRTNIECHYNYGIGGDDRCGVYHILELLRYCKRYNLPYPSILFTDGEEIGGRGVRNAVKKIYFKETYFVEIDRRGGDEVVFYGSDSDRHWTRFVCGTTGFDHMIGSFSDVSVIKNAYPRAKICNLSAGYYNEHQGAYEYICLSSVRNAQKGLRVLYKVLLEQA